VLETCGLDMRFFLIKELTGDYLTVHLATWIMHEDYAVRNGALALCDVRVRLSASPRVHIPISDSDAEPASMHAPFLLHACLYALCIPTNVASCTPMLHCARLCCIAHAYFCFQHA